MSSDRGYGWRAARRELIPFACIVGATSAIAMAEFALWHALEAIYGEFSSDFDKPPVYSIPVALLGFTFWGFWRAGRLNPVDNQEYRRWLGASPWTAAKPLPFGRKELHWVDWIPVACAVAASYLHPLGWVVAALYFGAYSLSMLGSTATQGHYVVATIGAAGFSLLPAAVLFAVMNQAAWPVVACIAWTIPWAWLGWRYAVQTLAAQDVSELINEDARVGRTKLQSAWPRVHPWNSADLGPALSRSLQATIVIAGGWIAGVAMLTGRLYLQACPPEEPVSLAVIALVVGCAFGGLAALVRLMMYLGHCQTPLGLWARLLTGRLVIPGYDRVLLAPLATVLVAIATAAATYRGGTAAELAVAVNVMAPLAAALFLPPSLADWRLTGGYKMYVKPPPRQRARRQSTNLGVRQQRV